MFYRILVVIKLLCIVSCASKYTKKYNQNSDFCSNIKPNDVKGLAHFLQPYSEKMKTKTGVYSLEDGGNSLILRAWLCDNAQKTIDIQYYIFMRDNTGLIASDHLVRAADRGVKVRIIVDDITVKSGSEEIHTLDSHENIEIRVYNPGFMLGTFDRRMKMIFTKPRQIHRRMHNKTITVDNLASITGGRNIADEYFDFDKKYNFRDRDVLLLGKSAPVVTQSFEQFWNDPLCVTYTELVNEDKKKFRDPHRFNRLHQYACDPANFSPAMREKIKNYPDTFRVIEKSGRLIWTEGVSFVSDIPGKNEEKKSREGGVCTDSIVAILKNAKKTVDIQSPYLITTNFGKNIFKELVARGVKVRVLTNSLGATDNYEAFSGYQRDRKATLETGIEVYEFKPDAQVRYKVMTPEVQSTISYTAVLGLHSKTMLIDDMVTVIGSYNLDPRSANLNTECVAIIRSKEVTKNVAKYVNEEFLPENAWRITPEFNPDEQAGYAKRSKAASRKIIPKDIL